MKIVRLDLDRCELDMIEILIINGVVKITDVLDCRLIREMSEYERLMWSRNVGVRRFDQARKVG